MPRLIGAMKSARIADDVIGLCYSLVDGPVSFFARKQECSTYVEDWEAEFESEGPESWKPIAARAIGYDVELWVDPTPNGQLQQVQLLNWWRACPGRSGPLSLFQAPKQLGHCLPDEISVWRDEARPATAKQFEAAELAWQAYCSPTPEAWHALWERVALPICRSFNRPAGNCSPSCPPLGRRCPTLRRTCSL